jgi:hypothetical protein
LPLTDVSDLDPLTDEWPDARNVLLGEAFASRQLGHRQHDAS